MSEITKAAEEETEKRRREFYYSDDHEYGAFEDGALWGARKLLELATWEDKEGNVRRHSISIVDLKELVEGEK